MVRSRGAIHTGIMIVQLARFSLGRVLMHLIAMLGDRAVRFHAAGIAREFSWVTETTPPVVQVGVGVLGALARHLAQAVKRFSPSIAADAQSLYMMLRHDAVLGTEGNARVTALMESSIRSPWTHAHAPISSSTVPTTTKEYRR